MMFPFRRRPTPKPTAKKHTPKAPVPAPDELHLQRLDYDLQPLNVESLSHYIEPIVEDERFRVH